jgi:hypothetical protein
MRIYDAVAGTIKSGGKSRRAAKMQTLKCWHPDILDFVRCKSVGGTQGAGAGRGGYPSDFNGDAYSTVAFQNCNMSVRLTDEFMNRIATSDDIAGVGWDRPFPLRRQVRRGRRHVDALSLLTEIAEGFAFLRRSGGPIRGPISGVAHDAERRADQQH